MKKIVFILIVTAFISSCKKENVTMESNSIDNMELIKKLKQYNAHYIYNSSSIKTGFWETVGEVCKVAGADIIGAGTAVWASKEIIAGVGLSTGGTGAAVVAGVAGVIGGAGASYAAASQIYSGDGQNPGFSDVTPSEEYQYFDDMGKLHNKILKNVYYGDLSIYEFIEKEYPSIYNDVKKIIENSKWKDINIELKILFENYSDTDYDYEIAINKLYSKNLITANIKEILTLYLQAYVKSKSLEDVDNISNYYINKIEKSDLNNEEKETLIVAFLVGANSPYFWIK